ncbi:MAG: S1C family serine protease [Oscillospiraceae bacterium]|nr:S1C family serine protease [Oscillospiraceae bacterium]
MYNLVERKPKKVNFFASSAIVVSVVLVGIVLGYGISASTLELTAENSRSGSQDGLQIPTDERVSNDELLSERNSERLAPRKSENETFTTEELYEEVKDTVVGIKRYQRAPYALEEIGRMVASGVIFTTDGYLLTNHHVISDGGRFTVLVNDYKDETIIHEFPATIIGSDEPTDLAILKIERNEGFKAASLGDSDTLKIGQTVCPIGNPMGLSKSMTQGIVSGLNRESKFELNSIQFDAAVNMGNSGGPLFDMHGNVVGIVNEKYSTLMFDSIIENIGFAIAISPAKPIINDLLAHGEVVSRPMLGITILTINSYISEQMGLFGVNSGLLITSVLERSSAYEKGIVAGDIIAKINGNEVSYPEDVHGVIRSLNVGDTVVLTITRFESNNRQRFYDIEVELIASAE